MASLISLYHFTELILLISFTFIPFLNSFSNRRKTIRQVYRRPWRHTTDIPNYEGWHTPNSCFFVQENELNLEKKLRYILIEIKCRNNTQNIIWSLSTYLTRCAKPWIENTEKVIIDMAVNWLAHTLKPYPRCKIINLNSSKQNLHSNTNQLSFFLALCLKAKDSQKAVKCCET